MKTMIDEIDEMFPVLEMARVKKTTRSMKFPVVRMVRMVRKKMVRKKTKRLIKIPRWQR